MSQLEYTRAKVSSQVLVVPRMLTNPESLRNNLLEQGHSIKTVKAYHENMRVI
jgi:hypothetical protein